MLSLYVVYLACLLFGGLLLLVSIFFGGDSDMGFDLEVDADLDADFDAAAEVSGEGMIAAVKFLSFRNIVFFIAFFGLAGSLLTWMKFNAILTFLAAVAMGLFAAFLGHAAMTYLKKSESGAGTNLRELEGRKAAVLVNVSREHRGKISVSAKDRVFQLLAAVAEESSRDHFDHGDAVTIVRVENGTAFVAEESFIQS